MKIAPVSAGLLVELALGAAVLLAVLYAYKKAKLALPAGLEYINPASQNNVANRATNAAVSAMTGREETLGGWLYSVTHADPVANPSKVIDYSATGAPLVTVDGVDFGQLSG